jgi:hypothetical protein
MDEPERKELLSRLGSIQEALGPVAQKFGWDLHFDNDAGSVGLSCRTCHQTVYSATPATYNVEDLHKALNEHQARCRKTTAGELQR